MGKPRKQKDYNPAFPIKGVIECDRQHRTSVVDLNPELGSIKCPVCGGYTNIVKGLQSDGLKR
jgi:hypothetical protein